MFQLSAVRLDFVLKAQKKGELPPYKGSLLRGGLGMAFRRLACLQPGRECFGCMYLAQCAYAYVFETPEGTLGGKVGHERVPHPFLLIPDLDAQTAYQPGDLLAFQLLLMGQGVHYAPYFISAFQNAAKSGLGKDRIPFELAQVMQEGAEGRRLIWDGGDSLHHPIVTDTLRLEEAPEEPLAEVQLRFLTPLRLAEKGKVLERVTFPQLMRALFRRLDLLGRAHGQGPLDAPYRDLLALAEGVEADCEGLRWTDWIRYSNRQKTKVAMGGMTGTLRLRGELGPFLPYLRLGEEVHLGKGTVFGFGRYQLL